MSLEKWMIIATIAGPVLAIVITKYWEGFRFLRDRRLSTFRMLLAEKAVINIEFSKEFINALNLVYVDYAGQKKVIEERNKFRDFVVIGIGAQETSINEHKIVVEYNRLLGDLLIEMARTLRIKIEQKDILNSLYSPQAWRDNIVLQSEFVNAQYKYYRENTPSNNAENEKKHTTNALNCDR